MSLFSTATIKASSFENLSRRERLHQAVLGRDEGPLARRELKPERRKEYGEAGKRQCPGEDEDRVRRLHPEDGAETSVKVFPPGQGHQFSAPTA